MDEFVMSPVWAPLHSWQARSLFNLHYGKQTWQIRCGQWVSDTCRLLGHSIIYLSLHTTLTAEVESLVSESAFSTSPSVLSLGVFFLLLLGDSFPFLAFLFGEPTFPTSHLGHRTCEEETVSINLHLVPLRISLKRWIAVLLQSDTWLSSSYLHMFLSLSCSQILHVVSRQFFSRCRAADQILLLSQCRLVKWSRIQIM